MKRRPFLIALTSLLCLASISEMILRTQFGFCQAVLFRTDPGFEYIQIPQSVTRFGNLSFYNSFSQRNREPTANDTTVVLGLGDSVLNGGVLVTQDSLASSLLTSALTRQLGRPVLFANASAGSWGPDNCFAYLREYGDFGAKAILLAVSSHDAFDNMDFKEVVGKHPSYPNEQAPFALWELWERYLLPRIMKFSSAHKPVGEDENLRINKYRPGAEFNSGFADIRQFAERKRIPFIIYLHAEKGETKAGAYNSDGQKIIAFCRENKVRLIEELDEPLPMDAYLDKIHLSSKGQKFLFFKVREAIAISLQPNT